MAASEILGCVKAGTCRKSRNEDYTRYLHLSTCFLWLMIFSCQGVVIVANSTQSTSRVTNPGYQLHAVLRKDAQGRTSCEEGRALRAMGRDVLASKRLGKCSVRLCSREIFLQHFGSTET